MYKRPQLKFSPSASRFLDHVKNAFVQNPQLKTLLMDEYFITSLADAQDSWRRVVVTAIQNGLPTPAFSSALSFYDSFRCARLPANLLQVHTVRIFNFFLNRITDLL